MGTQAGLTLIRSIFPLALVTLILVAAFYLSFGQNSEVVKAAQDTPDTPGAITGMVRDADGQPLAAIAVSAYEYNSNGYPKWTSIRTNTTDESGTYRLPLLAAGLYRLEFVDTEERHITTFYPTATSVLSGTDIAVAGNVVAGIDMQLALGGMITGTIAISDARQPAYIYARALSEQDGHWQSFHSKEYREGTDRYAIGALSPNIYRVCVRAVMPGYPHDLTECYDDVASGVENALDIPIVAGQTISNINFFLGDQGDRAQLMGVVTDDQGNPLPGIDVTLAITPNAEAAIGSSYVTQTDELGRYHFETVMPVTYTLELFDSRGAYALTYFGGAATMAQATPIHLMPRETRTINMQLLPGAAITGVVTVDGEAPYLVHLLPYQQTKNGWQALFRFNQPQQGNRYRLSGLPAGSYRLKAGAVFGRQDGHFSGFYGGADLNSATTFVLRNGEVKTAIDIDLTGPQLHGKISGRVTTAGTPLPDIRVYLYYDRLSSIEPPPLPLSAATFDNPQTTLLEPVVYTTTNHAGQYTLAGFSDGAYIIQFVDPGQSYANSYFNPAGMYRRATPLYVEHDSLYVFDGSPIASVDGELVRGGSLQGRVRLADGQPVAGVIVNATASANGVAIPLAYDTTTDASGMYTLHNIYPTTYRISFAKSGSGYDFAEYYGAPDGANFHFEDAADVLVTAGNVTTNIDLILGPDPKVFIPLIATK